MGSGSRLLIAIVGTLLFQSAASAQTLSQPMGRSPRPIPFDGLFAPNGQQTLPARPRVPIFDGSVPPSPPDLRADCGKLVRADPRFDRRIRKPAPQTPKGSVRAVVPPPCRP